MSDQRGGPVMICATPVMRPGATRIGRIGTITFPRTVAVPTLIACVVGAFVGLGIAVTIAAGPSSLMYGTIFGGGAGWFLVTYSPLKGESMAKWLALQMNTSRRGRYIDGERVTLAVGTAILPKPPAGQVRLLRSAVRIPSSQYDERGVLISPGNKNLPADGEIDPLLFAALSLPGEGRTAMTPVDGLHLGAKRPTTPRKSKSKRPAPAAPTAPTAAATPAVAQQDAHLKPSKPQRLKD